MTAIHRAAPFLALAFAVSVAGCSVLYDPPPAAVAPAEARPPGPIGPADLAAQRALWDAQGIDDYTWDVAFGCECLLNGPTTVAVVDGEPTSARNNGKPVDLASIEGFPLTIDGVFDEAARTLEGGGTVTAEWAPQGLPRQLSLDRNLQAVDDELGITILQVAPGS
jgi:hypothetical protein